MTNQKGFAPILVVLIIAALAFGGYYYFGIQKDNKLEPIQLTQSTQTTEDAANWKTYTNSKFLYSVQYPSSYKISNSVAEVKTQPDNSPFMYIAKGSMNINNEDCPKFATFVIIKNLPTKDNRPPDYSDSINIDDFLKTKVRGVVKDSHDFDRLNTRLKDEKVDNNTVLVFDSEIITYKDGVPVPNASKKVRKLIVDRDEYTYIIKSCLEENSKEDQGLYNQILSTFKFTDQDQTNNDEEVIQNLVSSTWRKNIQAPANIDLVVSKVKIEGEYATVDAYEKTSNTGETVSSEGILILAKKISGAWNLAYKGTATYNPWLDAIPEKLIRSDLKPLLK